MGITGQKNAFVAKKSIDSITISHRVNFKTYIFNTEKKGKTILWFMCEKFPNVRIEIENLDEKTLALNNEPIKQKITVSGNK